MIKNIEIIEASRKPISQEMSEAIDKLAENYCEAITATCNCKHITATCDNVEDYSYKILVDVDRSLNSNGELDTLCVVACIKHCNICHQNIIIGDSGVIMNSLLKSYSDQIDNEEADEPINDHVCSCGNNCNCSCNCK